MQPAFPPLQRNVAFIAIVLATILNFAATDLVLPAIPMLPHALAGTPEEAQHVLAAYVAGFAGGLLLFGELGARHAQQPLLAASLLLFALLSWSAGRAETMPALIALRFVQGVTAAAGAAFAPGILRRIFSPQQAVRAIGLQGSIESLMPALAPIAGAWLLTAYSWRASFVVLAAASALVAFVVALMPSRAFPPPASGASGGYLQLLRNREVSRHGFSQAFSLAGLLVIVLGAPAVMVSVWGGPLGDFIRMQVVGVATFIAAVQLSHRLSRRYGDEAVILGGSLVSAAGCVAVFLYALAGGRSAAVVTVIWIAVNGGFGLRGPAGFLRAIVAAGGDDSRAAAMVILAILLSTAAGTVVVAPWITSGLAPVAGVASALSLGSVLVLVGLRRQQEPPLAP
ncbi:MFS transporter [Ramlibacter henchirensis]|uniref:MFS transporter n=1 Tax=Ramlibacter henchirensis TaxID=204072 RepID=A0A4Z0C9U3_9BURK|nr:MFS transporter [Ramlibacter henchirensis]TFZ07178.1 MFS transporter [Ramlibacter henchirensis]